MIFIDKLHNCVTGFCPLIPVSAIMAAMKFIFSYMKKYSSTITFHMIVKLLATFLELMIPYVLEHMIDKVAPARDAGKLVFFGCVMLLLAFFTRLCNLKANRNAVKVGRDCTYEIRRDLFVKTVNLSGTQTDIFGLPSLTARMTSDSYNVQNFIRSIQTLGVRAPMLLLGGIILTMTMDVMLSLLLAGLAFVLIVVVVIISRRGIALYDAVQKRVDSIVKVMRENISGVRVIRSLSKEEYEQNRYEKVNSELAARDIKAGTVMAMPGPAMTFILNMGLAFVVLIGAKRVNSGETEPGVILAFLTYFNMILMGVMGLNRVFLMTSKASASAGRISAVIKQGDNLKTIPDEEALLTDSKAFVKFDNVSFMYGSEDGNKEERRMSLKNISFEIEKGGSLGIIGPTGSGKSTILNLMMRFYDTTEGAVFIDGKDIRTYDRQKLRARFGVALQNDTLFADTIRQNISFGRNVSDAEVESAAKDAMAYDFISSYPDSFNHMSDIHGANFSGGQKQRLLISRAIAGNPDILILDDSSSALDYRTDSEIRKALKKRNSDCTTVIIAQRISSIMNLDKIMVLDEGRITGYGTHGELMASCPSYREIFNTQMGEER